MVDTQNLVKKWYIIHTYSGYEKKVCADLEKRIQTLALTDRVFRVIVPEEEKIEIVEAQGWIDNGDGTVSFTVNPPSKVTVGNPLLKSTCTK